MGRTILTTCGQWGLTVMVMLGLLLTPVTCTLVDHPHSLFDTPEALERSGHSAHAAHGGQTDATHLAMMVHGAPPLAGPVPLPELHPGTVIAWLSAETADATAGIASGATTVPGLGSLPSVSAAAMAMVASGQTALHVTLLLLLAVALIATRHLATLTRLTGQTLATVVPPPRRLSPI